jgi:hypothetical protein
VVRRSGDTSAYIRSWVGGEGPAVASPQPRAANRRWARLEVAVPITGAWGKTSGGNYTAPERTQDEERV